MFSRTTQQLGLPRAIAIVLSRGATLLVAVVMSTVALAQPDEQSSWEFTPYRVRLILAFDNDSQLTSELQTRVPSQILERIDAYIGAPWEVNATLADGALRWRMLKSLDNIDPATEVGADPFDKLWLVSIHSGNPRAGLRLREFDALTQHWGPTLDRPITHLDRLGEEVFRALLDVFAPLGEIDVVENKTAQIRWRGGALPTRDSEVRFVHKGDVLQPFLRQTDRGGKTRKVQNIDWTYLVVDATEANRSSATVFTGLRSPLAKRKRGRVQQLVLAVRNAPAPTELQLVSRGEDARPLASYEVYAYGPDSPETTLLGYTNARGRLAIPPGPGPLRILLVKNGNELLARIPVVPGARPTMELRLADDAPRLAAEGFLIGLQERMIDVVVRRHVLIARIKLRIEAGQLEEATRLLDELRRLDSQQQFLIALDQEQQKSLSSDASVQRKIEKLFSDARKLVGEHLDPRDVNRIEIELDQARRAQASAQPAKAPAN